MPSRRKDTTAQEINEEVKKRLDALSDSLQADRSRIQVHWLQETPWKEVGRLAQHLAPIDPPFWSLHPDPRGGTAITEHRPET